MLTLVTVRPAITHSANSDLRPVHRVAALFATAIHFWTTAEKRRDLFQFGIGHPRSRTKRADWFVWAGDGTSDHHGARRCDAPVRGMFRKRKVTQVPGGKRPGNLLLAMLMQYQSW